MIGAVHYNFFDNDVMFRLAIRMPLEVDSLVDCVTSIDILLTTLFRQPVTSNPHLYIAGIACECFTVLLWRLACAQPVFITCPIVIEQWSQYIAKVLHPANSLGSVCCRPILKYFILQCKNRFKTWIRLLVIPFQTQKVFGVDISWGCFIWWRCCFTKNYCQFILVIQSWVMVYFALSVVAWIDHRPR